MRRYVTKTRLTSRLACGGHDSHNTQQLDITSAKPGRIVAKYLVGRSNREWRLLCALTAVNRVGTLHGGMVATLVDSVGSLAVASTGLASTGVSTDITATFVRPAGKEGDTVQATGEVLGIGTSTVLCTLTQGKSLAYTRVEVRDPASLEILGARRA